MQVCENSKDSKDTVLCMNTSIRERQYVSLFVKPVLSSNEVTNTFLQSTKIQNTKYMVQHKYLTLLVKEIQKVNSYNSLTKFLQSPFSKHLQNSFFTKTLTHTNIYKYQKSPFLKGF